MSIDSQELPHPEDEKVIELTFEENDPGNPSNWSLTRKYIITGVLLFSSTLSMLYPGATLIIKPELEEWFHVGSELATFPTVFFLWGLAMGGPFIHGPLSEIYGRYVMLMVPSLIYILLLVGMAIPSHNFAGYVLLRYFGGLFSVALPTVSAGVLGDLWNNAQRAYPLYILVSSFFAGPGLGVFLEAFVADSKLGWRWLAWVMLFMTAVSLVLIVLTYRETYKPIILHRRLRKMKKEDPEKYKNYVSPIHGRNPVKLLSHTMNRVMKMLLSEPILVFISIYISIVYSILYGLLSMIGYIWKYKRNFTRNHQALIYLTIVAACVAGFFIYCILHARYKKAAQHYGAHAPPELHLRGAQLMAPLVVINILFLGWTGQYAQVPWYVPMIALFLLNISFIILIQCFFTFILDSYLRYAASAFAILNFSRLMLAGSFPLFDVQMFYNIGVHWSSVIFAGVCLLLAPIPFVLQKKGPGLRLKSQFAPAEDIKMKASVQSFHSDV